MQVKDVDPVQSTTGEEVNVTASSIRTSLIMQAKVVDPVQSTAEVALVAVRCLAWQAICPGHVRCSLCRCRDATAFCGLLRQ